MRKQLWFVLVTALLVSVVGIGAVAAQEKVVLKLGEPVKGTITKDVIEVSYSFSGKKGDIISIEAVPDPDAPDLDPTLELRNSDGETIGLNDDFSYPLALVLAELPADGDYVAVVGRAGGEEGESTGDYSLTVSTVELVGAGSTINANVSSDFSVAPQIYVMHPDADATLEVTFSQEIGENYASVKVLKYNADSYPDTIVSLDSTAKLSKATLTIDVEADNFYVLKLEQTSYSFSDTVEFPVTVEIK